MMRRTAALILALGTEGIEEPTGEPVCCERCNWHGLDSQMASLPFGNCPDCGSSWEVTEARLAALLNTPAEEVLSWVPDDLNADGHLWAQKFCEMYPQFDLDLMIGWFSNAIMSGQDLLVRDTERALQGILDNVRQQKTLQATPGLCQKAALHAHSLIQAYQESKSVRKPKSKDKEEKPREKGEKLPAAFLSDMRGKGKSFVSPKTKNKVMFESLPWDEQLKHYKRWKTTPEGAANVDAEQADEVDEKKQEVQSTDDANDLPGEFVKENPKAPAEPENLHPDVKKTFGDVATHIGLNDKGKDALQQHVVQQPVAVVQKAHDTFVDEEPKHGRLYATFNFIRSIGALKVDGVRTWAKGALVKLRDAREQFEKDVDAEVAKRQQKRTEDAKKQAKKKKSGEEAEDDKLVPEPPPLKGSIAKKVKKAMNAADDTSWVQPDYKSLQEALEKAAAEMQIDAEDLQKVIRNAKPEEISEEMWKNLNNSTSYSGTTPARAVSMAKEQGVDVDKLYAGFGDDMESPVIVTHNGVSTLVSGDAQLLASRSLEHRPTVMHLNLDKLPEGNRPRTTKPKMPLDGPKADDVSDEDLPTQD